MQRSDVPPADRRRFRTGRVCLDLVHTGGEGPAARWELVHGPADLGYWLAVLLELPEPVPADDGDVTAFRRLRSAVDRAARACAAGRRPGDNDLAVVNAAALAAPLVPQLARDTGTDRAVVGPDARAPLPPGVSVPDPTVSAVLSTLAREAIDVFGGPLATRIRECAAADCGLLFVDTSRPGTRRWCSMQRCGTLAKVRRHRG